MGRFRAPLAALIALVFYSITDILVWQRIFESNQLVEYADTYHTGWFVSLAGYAMMGIFIMADRWKDCLFFLSALGIGANSGLEDILYYVLDRRAMPEALPWLSKNPLIFNVNRLGVIASVAFWLIALTALYLLLFVWRHPRGAEVGPSAGRAGLDSRAPR